jgi:hypothetical protein
MEYQVMFYGGLAGAIITLTISIILYVKMGIAQVVEDLTGMSLRRKGSNRQQSQETANEKRMTKEILLKKQYADVAAASEETELLDGGTLDETSLLIDMEETTILSTEMEETSLLVEKESNFKKEVDVMVVHSTTII